MKNEKSKSTLALMEQAVMILVFAVAATLCVQAFVRADAYSKELERRDRAVNLCQTVAETVKAKKGDMEATAAQSEATVSGGMMFLYYNKEEKSCCLTDHFSPVVVLKLRITDIIRYFAANCNTLFHGLILKWV